MSKINLNHPTENHVSGVFYALGAFVIWGLLPLFFKELSHVPSLEFLGYRMIWSFVFLTFLLFFIRSLQAFITEIKDIITNKNLLLLLFLSAGLICSNWLVYIWAIAHEKVLETSLGYFINPLMSVALGMFVLKEKLTNIKLFAVALATFGVLYMIIKGEGFPWVALYLATSFAFYGLIRKKILVGAIIGLWVEILILLPMAIIYLFYMGMTQVPAVVSYDNYTIFLLVLSGAVTTIPLVLFTSAAKRLPLSTLGLLQYIAPTMGFLLAVFLWKEPFTVTHIISFCFIWGGIFIYTLDIWLKSRGQRLSLSIREK